MYNYDATTSTNTILVDTKDSYFRNHGTIIFNKQIKNEAKVDAVKYLSQNIPSRFLKSENLNQSFGCPDCNDGCGIYFEFQQGGLVKKLYIDYITKDLDKDIQDFAAFIVHTLVILNSKK